MYIYIYIHINIICCSMFDYATSHYSSSYHATTRCTTLHGGHRRGGYNGPTAYPLINPPYRITSYNIVTYNKLVMTHNIT